MIRKMDKKIKKLKKKMVKIVLQNLLIKRK